MKNKKGWLFTIGAVAVIALLAGLLFTPAKAKKTPDSPYSGVIEQQEYDLSFKIGGRVAFLPVEEGQKVKKGQLIGRLEKGEWQAKVDQAQAAVQLASANVAKAVAATATMDQTTQAKVGQAQASLKMAQDKFTELANGARPQEIAQLQAKVQAAYQAYQEAGKMQERMKNLYQSGAVSQTQKEQADVSYEQAKAAYLSAQKELELAQIGARQEELSAAKHQVEQAQALLAEANGGRGQVNISQADVKVAQGQLAQAEASLEEAETYLSYTELYAPVDGIVIHKNVQANEMVSQGFPAVTLADPQDKWVKFYVPEKALNGLKVNQKVTLYVPAINSQVQGVIETINPAPQFAVKKATNYLQETDVRSFEVKVKISEKQDQLYAGMTAEWQGVTNQ